MLCVGCRVLCVVCCVLCVVVVLCVAFYLFVRSLVRLFVSELVFQGSPLYELSERKPG